MAMTLTQLTNSLKADVYKPRTEEQLNTEAQNRYASVYDQKRQTAQQSYDTKDLAYQNQLNELANTLSYNQQTVQKNTADSIASANRYMINRGMQRSSYGAANQARLEAAGQGNLTKLLQDYNTDVNSVNTNRTLLAQQLADTLAGYDTDMQNDILAYIDEQKQLDYQRQQESQQYKNQIQMQLYQYGQQAKKKSSGGSSRSYSGGGSGGSSAGSSATPAGSSDLYSALRANANKAAADAQKAANDAARAAAVAKQRSNAGVTTTKKETDYRKYIL